MKKYIFLIVACCLVVGTMVYGIVINNQNKVNTDLSMTNQTLIEKIDTTMEKYQQLKIEYDNLQLAYDQEKRDHADDVQKATEQLSRVRQQLLELGLENNSLKEQIKNLDATNADQKTQIETLQSQIDANNAEISQLESEKTELEICIKSLTNNYGSSLVSSQILTQQITELDAEILEYVKLLNADNELWQKAYTGEITRFTVENFGDITEIQPYAFYGTKITFAQLPNSVTKIGKYAFAKSSLEKIICEDKVTDVDLSLGLYSRFSENVISLGSGCFMATNIDRVQLPVNFTNDGDSTMQFALCEKLEFLRAENLKSYPDYIFNGCKKLQSVKFNENITDFGVGAFLGCSTLDITNFPDSVARFGDYCFAGTKITNFDFPYSLTSIGNYSFAYCNSLIKVTSTRGCRMTDFKGSYSFAYCQKLKYFKMPDMVNLSVLYFVDGCVSLETVDYSQALSYFKAPCMYICQNLKTVVIRNVENFNRYNQRWTIKNLGTCRNIEEIFVPDSLLENFKQSTVWSEFFDSSVFKPLSEYVAPDLTTIA